MSNKKYDLVVYGASGFTGQLISEYLSTHKDTANLSWAIAGRDTAKLEKISNIKSYSGSSGRSREKHERYLI